MTSLTINGLQCSWRGSNHEGFFFFKLHVEYSFLYSCPLLNFSVSNGVYYFLKGVLLEITHLFTYCELHRSFIQASSVRFLFPLYHKPWRAGAMSFLCPSISKVEHMACCSMKTLQLRTEWMNEWASDWINEWHHNCHWMNNWMMSNLRQASLSIINSWSPPKPMSIESVMSSNHLILCRPLLLLPSIFPSIRVFSKESALCIRWPKYWSFSFNICPFNENPRLISFRMDSLDLHAVQGTLKSLLQHHSSKAPILQCSAFL